MSQLARVATQLVSTVVLARLLEPSSFGLVAFTMSIVGVAEVLRDFGLSTAAIQKRTLSHAEQSNLFWINSLLGLVLFIAACCASPLISTIANDSQLIPITCALSTIFLFNGCATQHRATLGREMRFTALAWAETAGPVVGLLGAIAAAISGAEVWSLVLQQVVAAVVGLCLSLFLGRWLPRRYSRTVKMRYFWSFGGNLVGVQLLTYASRNLDSTLIGAFFGTTILGLYDRAFQLLMQPLNQLNAPATKVALPVLSRIDDSAKYDEFLRTAQSVLLNVLFGIFALTAALASPLVEIVLGPGWSRTAGLFQILALGGAAQAASYCFYWVFTSKAMTSSNLRFTLATRPLVILGIFIGAFWGVEGVAWAYSIALTLIWPIGLIWLRNVPGFLWASIARNTLTPGIVYLAAGIATFIFDTLVGAGMAPIPRIASGTSVFVLIWVVFVLLWPAFRKSISSIRQVARLAVRQK